MFFKVFLFKKIKTRFLTVVILRSTFLHLCLEWFSPSSGAKLISWVYALSTRTLEMFLFPWGFWEHFSIVRAVRGTL